MDAAKKAELLEKLADLEHEQWIEWSKAVAPEVSEERRARWEAFWVPYDQLDEPTKDMDREWAEKALELLEPFLEAHEEQAVEVEEQEPEEEPVQSALDRILAGADRYPLVSAILAGEEDFSPEEMEAAIHPPKGQAAWGFDLTEISPENWLKVLQEVGISVEQKPELDSELSAWAWKGPGIEIFTACDPITGEFSRPLGDSERRDVGYASYIGIQGKPDLVQKAANAIKQHAEYVKDESPKKRDFI
jgi:hypothetical protein